MRKVKTQRLPKTKRRTMRVPGQLPVSPGEYYWDHWRAKVSVVKRGSSLYVTPPCKGAVEVKITPNIAGNFVAVP
jgi:hypothetical protein